MKIATADKSLVAGRRARLLFVLFTLIIAALAQKSASPTSTTANPQEPEYTNSFLFWIPEES